MLLGTEIGAALTALEPFEADILGLNCATGPKEMNDAVRYLALNSTKEVSVLPNAGLPFNEGGHAVYKLTPAGAGGVSQAFCGGLRRADRGRMLRNYAGAFEGGGGCGFWGGTGPAGGEEGGGGLERLHFGPA